jgi:M6 family metalloprotease-like protein
VEGDARQMIRFPIWFIPRQLLYFSVMFATLWCLTDSAWAVGPPKPGLAKSSWVTGVPQAETLIYGDSSWVARMQQRKVARQQTALGKSATLSQDQFTLCVLLGSYIGEAISLASAQSAYQDHLFHASNSNTMVEYYDEVSYSQFALTGTVYGPFVSDSTRSQAVNAANGSGGYVESVVAAADASVDFRLFDNDGPDGTPNSGDDDGYVDAVGIIYPGIGNDAGDNTNFNAHMSSLSSDYTTSDIGVSGDSIKVKAYYVASEFGSNGTTIRDIGVHCHEFGHVLGLPDLYDRTDASEAPDNAASEGLGEWGLMGSGSWGGDGSHGNTPAHMTAWSKIQMGWLTPTVVTSHSTITINDAESNPQAYIVYEEPYQFSRYFLLENRQQTGYDTYLNGPGLMIYHVDENKRWGVTRFSSGPVNNDETHKMIDVETADGLTHMDDETNRGDAGDPWPGSSNRTSFTNSTTPSTMDYSSASTDISITNISASSSSMTATLLIRPNSGYVVKYDSLGMSGYGWGENSTADQWSGVRFTTAEAGTLQVVDIGIKQSTAITYELKVYDGISGSTPGNVLATESGSVTGNYWHEIPITTDVVLAANTDFFVSFKYTSGPAYAVSFDNVGAKANRSYYSANGTSFSSSISSSGNVNMRARIRTDEDDIVAPLQPLNLAATQVLDTVKLDWDANAESDLSSYRVYRKSGSAPTTSDLLTTVTAPASSYSDASVSAGTPYYYKVAAVDSTGNISDLSDAVSIAVVSSISLEAFSAISVDEGETITITPVHNYTGSGSATFTLSSNIPAGESVAFNTSTGKLVWEASFEASGTYTLTFTLSDGTLSISKSVTVTITELPLTADNLSQPDTIATTPGVENTISVAGTGVYTRHQVNIPSAALSTQETVIARPPSTVDVPDSIMANVPSAVVFEVEGSANFTFDAPVAITLEYKDFEIGTNENNLRVHFWDTILNIWKRLPGTQTLDPVTNTIEAETDHFTVFGVLEVSEESPTTSFGGGWNMVSIPVELTTQNDPGSVLGDDIKSFRSGEGVSHIYAYDESTDAWSIPSTLENATGYITYSFEASNIDASGLEVTSDITTSLSYTSSNGWHLLGNPYSVSLDWDADVTRAASISGTYYYWDGSQYLYYPGGGLTAAIAPWQGFFTKTTVDNAALTFTYPGLVKPAVPVSDIDWRIGIQASSGKLSDDYTYCGVSEQSSTGYDDADVYELVPLNQQFLSVYFEHPDWIEPGNFTQDIRPTDTLPMIWELTVATNSRVPNASLTWDIPTSMPPELTVTLTELISGVTLDMSAQKMYTWDLASTVGKSTAPGPAPLGDNPADFAAKLAADEVQLHRFIITVAEQIEETAMVPDSYFLAQNYPNPFNPATTIRYGLPEAAQVTLTVYNLLGQKIRTLISGIQDAGNYELMWNGTNDQEQPVASGIYIYRMTAQNYEQSRKLLLLR